MFHTTTYFVEYSFLGNTKHIQVEAQSLSQAKMIFGSHYPNCQIKKIETTFDIAERIANSIIPEYFKRKKEENEQLTKN